MPFKEDNFALFGALLLSLIAGVEAQSTYLPSSGPKAAVQRGIWSANVIYDQWSGVFKNTLTFAADSLFLDGISGYWAATSSFTISLTPLSAADQDRLGYWVQSSGTTGTRIGVLDSNVQAANGYELRSSCSGGGCTCPYKSSLAHNDTSYSCYLLMRAGHLFSVQAVVAVGSQTIGTLVLQPWQSSSLVSSSNADMAGTAAVVKMTSLTRTANYDFYSGLLRWCLSNQAANASDPGFMVNTSAFGTAANQIGVSSENFTACANSSSCSSALYGACTAVNSGSPYDQFSTFRGQLWGQYIPLDSTWACKFLYNGPIEPDSSIFATQYSCNYSTALLQLGITAKVGLLPLAYGYSVINMLGASRSAWAPGSLSGQLQLRMQNTGNLTGQFTVAVDSCSDGTNLTTAAAVTQSVAPAKIVIFSFGIGVNQTGFSGSCSFAISGFGLEPQPGTRITYVATPPSPPPLPPPPLAPPPPPAPIYYYLNASVNFSGSGVYNDTFISRYKSAIAASASVQLSNVLILSTVYSRRKLQQLLSYVINMQVRFPPSMSSTAADSYETLLTENMAAAFASDSTFYSSYGPANALLGNFAIAYNSVNAPPPPPESTSPPPPGVSCGFGIPDCGIHGFLAAPCSCVCESGYTTDVNQDFSNFKYCNITTKALKDSQNSTLMPPPPPASVTGAGGGLQFYWWVVIVLALLATAVFSFRIVQCLRTQPANPSSQPGFFKYVGAKLKAQLWPPWGKKRKRYFKNALFEDEDGGTPSASSTDTRSISKTALSELPGLAPKAKPRLSIKDAVATIASGLMSQFPSRLSGARLPPTEAGEYRPSQELALLHQRSETSQLEMSGKILAGDPDGTSVTSSRVKDAAEIVSGNLAGAFYSPLAQGSAEMIFSSQAISVLRAAESSAMSAGRGESPAEFRSKYPATTADNLRSDEALPQQQEVKDAVSSASGGISHPLTTGMPPPSRGQLAASSKSVPPRTEATAMAETVRPKMPHSSLRPAVSASAGDLQRHAQASVLSKEAPLREEHVTSRKLERAGGSLPQPRQRVPEIQPLSTDQASERPPERGAELPNRDGPLEEPVRPQRLHPEKGDIGDAKGAVSVQLLSAQDSLRQLAARRPQSNGQDGAGKSELTSRQPPMGTVEPAKRRQDGVKQS